MYLVNSVENLVPFNSVENLVTLMHLDMYYCNASCQFGRKSCHFKAS